MYGCDDFAQRFTLNIRKRKKNRKGDADEIQGDKEGHDSEQIELEVKEKTVDDGDKKLVSSPSNFARLARKNSIVNKSFR